MARSTTATSWRASPSQGPAEGDDEEAARRETRRNRRESIESLVVVVVGFLVWSLEAEGFVIPTGSMAPTLLGRHKEVECPECGWTYRVNADCEVEAVGAGGRTGLRVTWGVCENCRFSARIDDRPSFAGDRIYTVKSDVAIPLVPGLGRVEPKRWDVTVFKLPEDPTVRYIKRLVGMPGEVLRIKQGNLWRSDIDDGEAFEILRRPPEESLQVNIPVHDDTYRPRRLASDPRWRRWTSLGGWEESTPGIYRAASDEGWDELRYRHVVPSPEQWEALAAGREPDDPPQPTLITDFSSFNTDLAPQNLPQVRFVTRPWFQPHWVGDLALSLRLDVAGPSGRVRIELIEAGVSNRCEIDLATGEARIFHGDDPLGESRPTAVKERGSFDLTFANIDDRLTLWVDGVRPFGDGLAYGSGEGDAYLTPTVDDLEPARIAVSGAEVAVGGLVLKRDVYYTQSPGDPDSDDLLDYRGRPPRDLFALLADPSRYGGLRWRTPRDYPIEAGRYMMLGDNSSWSRDGRAWTRVDQTTPTAPDRGWDDSGRESWEVPRALVIGRAFGVYWAHMRPVWPRFRWGPDLVLPARPNVEAVRWIY
ncbi:S26 family signal peptidase [Planctomyces sp. SH-PL62]|uniref:S26 family signal peptidase n=1 Tax=Planctomyces sp. SH-PL62 TaxID=1636152 RepID=UPI00078DE420|nr:S26 family signal peptidase [Planctomyces sp. SH-PL62]AMV39564.1 signal peptidase I [Planctomyces sp. SH-PL62]